MHQRNRRTTPRHYPLTDEDLRDIERGAPDTSGPATLAVIIFVLAVGWMLFK